MICGMKPEIALTLETMGVHLDNITSSLDLEGALVLLGVPKPDTRAIQKNALAKRTSANADGAAAASPNR